MKVFFFFFQFTFKRKFESKNLIVAITSNCCYKWYWKLQRDYKNLRLPMWTARLLHNQVHKSNEHFRKGGKK